MADTYTTTVAEIAVAAEVVTATLDVQQLTGERLTGPTIVGLYPDANSDDPELWIEQEGRRVQFPCSALPALVKQLRRAEKIAREASNG